MIGNLRGLVKGPWEAGKVPGKAPATAQQKVAHGLYQECHVLWGGEALPTRPQCSTPLGFGMFLSQPPENVIPRGPLTSHCEPDPPVGLTQVIL